MSPKLKIEINSNGRTRKGINRYIDSDFIKILNEIKKTRILLDKDSFNSITADWRITLAMARHPSMKKIKDDIINADLKNK